MLRLDDRWIWDFWTARHGGEHHVFYLQAPRSLGDPELRHRNASVGHAVSHDLVHWSVLPDALGPGPEGAWDDSATWTGSVLEGGGLWWMFYTGTSRGDGGLVQRVGAATSTDLTSWSKHPGNPLFVSDPEHYAGLDLGLWHDQAWRDPWILRRDDGFHAVLTSRALAGPVDGRGVIAHAESDDLVSWRVRGPLTVEPMGQFGEMEVPQILALDGRWYLLFCAGAGVHSRAWAQRTGAAPRSGTFYAVAGAPLGPYRLVDADPLGPDDGSTCYAGHIVETDDGPRFLAWRMLTADGTFAGELIDPIPVGTRGDGTLVLG